MIIFAPAKINLGLAVQRKRNDGFHELTSIFYPIPLQDVLEIVPSEHFELCILGLKIDCDLEQNILYKTFMLLKEEYDLPNVKIILQKNIPMGAGLGGGSSDAAHLIKALNTFFHLNLTNSKMEALSAELGSDCPFFIECLPKLVKGRGEVLLPSALRLQGFYLQLIYPALAIGTKEAFQGVVPFERPDIEKDWLNCAPEKWAELMKNDFEDSIFKIYPSLKEIKDQLYKNGAFYASMSGSGSTFFGLYKEEPQKLKKENTQEWIFELSEIL